MLEVVCNVEKERKYCMALLLVWDFPEEAFIDILGIKIYYFRFFPLIAKQFLIFKLLGL